MGGLSLVKPGLQYDDQGSPVDPSTGMPIQVKPRVAFFPNNQARNEQFVKDAHNAIQSAPMTIDSQTGAPVLGTPVLPKMFKPSFASVSGPDANGMPQSVNPAETKLGKLLHIIGAAAQGGIAGWGYGNAAQGSQAARDVPFQRAQRTQELQAGDIQNQQARANLATNPLTIAQKIAAIQAQQAETEKSLHGVHSTVFQPDPNNSEGYVQQGVDAFGKPTGAGIPAMLPGFLKPHTQLITVPNPQNPNGPPMYAEYDKLKHVVTDPNTGAVIPGAEKFVPGLVPKVSTDSSSSSTDLMGNTRTTNTRTTGPAPSGPNGLTPGQPRFAPTGTARPAAAPKPVPIPTTATAQASQLAPDVEQRLKASGLSPQAQQYMRGILGYHAQFPSPRAKNYASTVATATSLDPNFNVQQYQARQGLTDDLTRGKGQFSGLVPFNTAIAHLDQLMTATDALKNGNLPALNHIANLYKIQTGQSAPVVFDAVKQAIIGELGRVYKGSVTDQELAANGATLNKDMSADQIAGSGGAALKLMQSKIGMLNQFYKNGMGGKEPPADFTYPESHQILQRRGFEAGPTPQSHGWSLSGWKASNPKGDPKAAAAAATAAGFKVLP